MNRFVAPETQVLKISRGDTLTVKRRLNAGEQRAAFARMALAGTDGALRINPLEVGLATILAYLVDWSLTDASGKVVPISGQAPDVVAAALNALDPGSYAEIREAIEAHDAAVQEAREQEKNDQGTPSASVAT